MKFYLDEDISHNISDLLRKKNIDAVSAHDVDMVQASDKAQLEYAAANGRVMVTRNRNDFIQLTVLFFNDMRPHRGVLIIPRTLPGDMFSLIADAILHYTETHSEEMQPYTVDFLSAGGK